MGKSIVNPINTEAIEKATGVSWREWCVYLDDLGAAKLEHAAIVENVRGFRQISGWWAQSVAVAYEQHIGRRKPGQGNDGLFNASVSQTLALSQRPAFASWCAFAAGLNAIDGQKIAGAPTTSTTPKRLYWRCKFEDGGKASMGFEAKSEEKVLIAIEHSKLTLEPHIANKKRAWAALLDACLHR